MIPGAGVTTAIALFKRLWPVLAVVAVALALWAWGNSRYDAGVQIERGKWEAVVRRQALQAAQDAASREAAVNAANTARDAAQASLDALASQSKETAHAYYRNRPAVVCLSAERLRAIAEADKAATAAVAAK